uniref:Gluconokinase n=1 Tax=Trichuris muris TaxID=70415 RepID=A0A5S6QUP0_TRIMR
MVDVSLAVNGDSSMPLCDGLTIVLMGVSGSGKSTVGKALSIKLGIPFLDGDDYHSPLNKAKMCRGEPLSDEDRSHWLFTISELAEQFHAKGQAIIIGCSALKQQYRQYLMGQRKKSTYIFHLQVPLEVAENRVRARTDHFFKPWLLKSQYETLQSPSPDEFHIINIDASQPITIVVSNICTFLKSLSRDDAKVVQ